MATTSDAIHDTSIDVTVHNVVTAIAEQTGTDVLDLPPLNDSIDTDALTALLESGSAPEVEFPYDGYTVTVDGDGRVRVADGDRVA